MSNHSLFSVVMPTYRRLDALRRVLSAYEQQEPHDLPFEVVVVDDGSGDETAAFLANLRPRRFQYRFASQANAGPAAARNHALSLARGEVVLFTGDDIEPTATLLADHWRAHQRHDTPEVVVLGRTAWPPGVPTTATMRHIDGPGAQQFSYHYLEDGETYDFRHFYTSNVSIRRSLLDREPSYFSTAFPAAAFEDAELAYRLAGHGARIVYHAAPLAYHHHPYTAPGFFRRQERCGAMAAVLYDLNPALSKYLGIRELAWARLDALAQPASAGDLATLEQHALQLATFCDGLDRPPVDNLFLELFRYGFMKGLAEARLEPEMAQRVLHKLFLDTIPPAVAHYGRLARKRGLPLPTNDLDTLTQFDTVAA